MNIESLITKIELFEDLIIESGFKRDVQDYIQSIQQGQNQNLVFMKDLSQKVKEKLIECENFGLDSELKAVLRDNDPFTEIDTLSQLEELDSDTEIIGNAYFSKFSQILNQLFKTLTKIKMNLIAYLVFFKNM